MARVDKRNPGSLLHLIVKTPVNQQLSPELQVRRDMKIGLLRKEHPKIDPLHFTQNLCYTLFDFFEIPTCIFLS